MVTIIFAYPKHDGMNGKVYHSILKHCREVGIDYTSIDLYKDGFSPVLTKEEWGGFCQKRIGQAHTARGTDAKSIGMASAVCQQGKRYPSFLYNSKGMVFLENHAPCRLTGY